MYIVSIPRMCRILSNSKSLQDSSNFKWKDDKGVSIGDEGVLI